MADSQNPFAKENHWDITVRREGNIGAGNETVDRQRLSEFFRKELTAGVELVVSGYKLDSAGRLEKEVSREELIMLLDPELQDLIRAAARNCIRASKEN